MANKRRGGQHQHQPQRQPAIVVDPAPPPQQQLPIAVIHQPAAGAGRMRPPPSPSPLRSQRVRPEHRHVEGVGDLIYMPQRPYAPGYHDFEPPPALPPQQAAGEPPADRRRSSVATRAPLVQRLWWRCVDYWAPLERSASRPHEPPFRRLHVPGLPPWPWVSRPMLRLYWQHVRRLWWVIVFGAMILTCGTFPVYLATSGDSFERVMQKTRIPIAVPTMVAFEPQPTVPVPYKQFGTSPMPFETTSETPATAATPLPISKPTRPPLPTIQPAYQHMPFDMRLLADAAEHQPDGPIRGNNTWQKDNQLLVIDRSGVVWLHHMAEDRPVQLIDLSNAMYNMRSIELSPDGSHLLVGHWRIEYVDNRPYRRNAYYYEYRVRVAEWTFISDLMSRVPMRAAFYGTHGTQLTYVTWAGGKLWYRPSAKQPYRTHLICDATTMGPYSRVGEAIWIYERALWNGEYRAVWFSPDGVYMAYAVFDDGVLHGSPNTPDPIPTIHTANPTVLLFVVRVEEMMKSRRNLRRSFQLEQPLLPKNEAPLLVAVHWTTDRNLVVVWTDRLQATEFMYVCSVRAECKQIDHHHPDQEIALDNWTYFKQHPQSIFSNTSNQLVYIQPLDAHPELLERDPTLILNQIVSLERTDAGALLNIRRHRREHLNHERIVHFDVVHGRIFFLGSNQQDPEERDLYVTNSRNFEPSLCVTCRLRGPVSYANYHHFDVRWDHDPHSQLFVLYSQGPSMPRIDVFEWHSHNNPTNVHLRHLRELQTFAALREAAGADATQPVVRYERMHLKTGVVACVRLLLPPQYERTCRPDQVWRAARDGRDEELRQFPLVVRTSDGPDTFVGEARWPRGFDQYLVSNRSYVVAIVDGWGSGRLSRTQTYLIGGRLGWLEAGDVQYATQKLVQQMRCVDGQRTIVRGGGEDGYGGMVAALALHKDRDNGVFRCGVVETPVVEWDAQPSFMADRWWGGALKWAVSYSDVQHFEDFGNKTMLVVWRRNATGKGSDVWTRAVSGGTHIYGRKKGEQIGSKKYFRLIDDFMKTCFDHVFPFRDQIHYTDVEVQMRLLEKERDNIHFIKNKQNR